MSSFRRRMMMSSYTQFDIERQTSSMLTFLEPRIETNKNIKNDGEANIIRIEGNTFVWNQLFEGANSEVTTIATAIYYKRINGVDSVFKSNGEVVTSQTNTDMLVNLTHLYGTNSRNFLLNENNENTITQFKQLFPLDYYPYSESTIINCNILNLNVDNGNYHKSFNIDIKNITGKLNGSGDSVKVFPDGMDNAGLADYIYNDDGVWKAVARNKRLVFALAGKTYVQDGAYRVAIGTGATNAPYYGTNSNEEVVCDHYMTSTFAIMYVGVDGEGYCAIRRKSNEYTCYFYVSNQDYAKGVENLPTVNIVYPLLNASTYILDDTWQTILDQIFSYSKNSILSLTTDLIKTAPISLQLSYNVKVKRSTN